MKMGMLIFFPRHSPHEKMVSIYWISTTYSRWIPKIIKRELPVECYPKPRK
jgi:hypothetical protein